MISCVGNAYKQLYLHTVFMLNACITVTDISTRTEVDEAQNTSMEDMCACRSACENVYNS